jgi:hypothetical protein
VGRSQGFPTFKEAAWCSDQPVRGAAWDTGGPPNCPSDKPEGASPGPMKLKAWCPGVEPACLGRGAGVPHAKPLVQTRCMCRMAASRQENRSCPATEGTSGKGDGGGSHHRVLREVSWKGWPHGNTGHPGNGVGIPGPASRVSTVPTIPVFLGLDCRASQANFQGAVVLTPIVRPAVRRPPRLGRELNICRSGVHFLLS